MSDFNEEMSNYQEAWRKTDPDTRTLPYGMQSKYVRSWILPKDDWEKGLWHGIRNTKGDRENESLAAYIKNNRVQKHTGSHNLKSSWMLCANLYFPFRGNRGGSAQQLISGFLRENICSNLKRVTNIELEFEHEAADINRKLGESRSGSRGQGQTSPDVAFIFETDEGEIGIILTEVKFTEHSFYRCSGRNKDYGIKDSMKCRRFEEIYNNIDEGCYQRSSGWEKATGDKRRYWNQLTLSDEAKHKLKYCPAAIAGYQLFRQQAYAELLRKESNFDPVFSTVAYDRDNKQLTGSLRSSGVAHWPTDWSGLFEGAVTFDSWTHQDWIKWVREHDSQNLWGGWLSYVENRYGYDKDGKSRELLKQ